MMAYMNTEQDPDTHGGAFSQSGSVILHFGFIFKPARVKTAYNLLSLSSSTCLYLIQGHLLNLIHN